MVEIVCAIIRLVKIKRQPTISRYRWLRKPIASGPYQTWLTGVESLTSRLQMTFADFSVCTLSMRIGKPFVDELSQMRMVSRQRAWLRNVQLMGNGNAVVFAHSVLPRPSLRGPWMALRKLGNKPLGGSLFANPRVRRSPLVFKKLTAQHPLYRLATASMATKPNDLWARRSCFTLGCSQIMVTEVFLPQVLIR